MPNYAKDFFSLISWKLTPNGYLLVKVAFAKWGTQKRLGVEISPDFEAQKVYTELRTKEEVTKNIGRWKHVIVTNNHPEPMLNSQNTKLHAVGYPSSEIVVNEETKNLTCELLIFDEQTIAEIKNGKSQLSAGYTYNLVKVENADYDFLQTDIEPNHIAIVDRGRCGSSCTIATDTQPNTKETQMKKIIFKKLLPDGTEHIILEIEVSKESAPAVQEVADKIFTDSKTMVEASKKTLQQKDELEAETKELKSANDALQAKLDNAPTPATDADILKQVETLANERVAVAMVAKDAQIETADKTVQEIKKEVIEKYKPQIALDGKSESYIDVSFDLVAENIKNANDSFLQANKITPATPNPANDAETTFNTKY